MELQKKITEQLIVDGELLDVTVNYSTKKDEEGNISLDLIDIAKVENKKSKKCVKFRLSEMDIHILNEIILAKEKS